MAQNAVASTTYFHVTDTLMFLTLPDKSKYSRTNRVRVRPQLPENAHLTALKHSQLDPDRTLCVMVVRIPSPSRPARNGRRLWQFPPHLRRCGRLHRRLDGEDRGTRGRSSTQCSMARSSPSLSCPWPRSESGPTSPGPSRTTTPVIDTNVSCVGPRRYDSHSNILADGATVSQPKFTRVTRRRCVGARSNQVFTTWRIRACSRRQCL